MAEKKLVTSLSQVGTNIRELAKERYAGLKSVFSLPGNIYRGDEPASIQNAMAFGGLVNIGGGGGGGPANIGMLQKGLMKKMAKGLRKEGKHLPKRWKKAHMQGLQSIPDTAAAQIDDLVALNLGPEKANTISQMWTRMDDYTRYKVNTGFTNPKGLTPRTVLKATRESGLHEATHAMQKRKIHLPKDLENEMQMNVSSSLMKNSSRRFAVLSEADKAKAYSTAIHEVHAKALGASEVMYRDMLKKKVKINSKEINALYRDQYIYYAKEAIKELKKTNPGEYRAIINMTKRDILNMYGDKAKHILKEIDK